MNEYVQHGRNGYLYNFEAPMPLDFVNLRTLCNQAAADVKDGHHAWQAQEKAILAYLASILSASQRVARWFRGLRKR